MTNEEVSNSNSASQRKESIASGHSQERSLVLSNEFLNKLTHSVGHDLRSPMFVIRSYAQLLKRNQDKDRLDRGLNMIEDATMSMERIIDGLIQLVDIYTNPIPTFEYLDFQSVFEDVQLQLCNEIEEFKPTFKCDFSDSPSINFSASYLVVIMSNLVDNSMRHNADVEELTIQIVTRQEGNKTMLSIFDNGKNKITPKELAKFKDPFYSDANDQSLAGTGLSKVEAIAQKVNGEFKVENPKDQEKLMCTFVFP